MTALAPVDAAQLAIPGLQLSATGATLDRPLTAADAATVFRHLDRASTSLNWWIGDITLATMDQVRGGDDAMKAVDPPSDQPNTARCVHVAERVTPERRRADLTWSHHAEVAALPPDAQVRLLATAAENGLSVRALRAVIQQEAEDARGPGLDLQDPPPLPRPPASQLRALLAEDPDAFVLWQPSTGMMRASAVKF